MIGAGIISAAGMLAGAILIIASVAVFYKSKSWAYLIVGLIGLWCLGNSLSALPDILHAEKAALAAGSQ